MVTINVHPYAAAGVTGTLYKLGPVHSTHLNNERDIFVWVPSNYEAHADRRYPVIYMQDGQNLFSDELAFGKEWRVDEGLERLSTLGLDAIAVGIPNAGAERLAEYSPFVDAEGRGGRGELYVRFVHEEVMPLVAKHFRVLATRDATGIMGSSMGALISLYAYFQLPEVFGFVGAMSPSIWFADAAILPFIEQQSGANGRVYLDIGTAEGEAHVGHVQHLHRILLSKGYRQGETLFYVEEDMAQHDEEAWAKRLRTALYFRLPPTPHT
jgi:predicted alpha/beta superfamily hydrolase